MTEPAAGSVDPDGYPSASYSWYVVVVLTIVYVFSFLDRQILSMMVVDLKNGLNLEHDWQVDFLMGPAFAIFYTIFGIPLGRLADSRNRKGLIAIGMTLWCLMTAGCGLTKNFLQMAILRAGVGVGEASLSPSAYSIITDYFRPEKLARGISCYSMGIYFGIGMAYLIGGKVIVYVRQTEAWNLPVVGIIEPWQKAFFFIGIPGLLIIPLLLLSVAEPRRRGLLKTREPRSNQAVPFQEVLRYIGNHWRTIVSHNVGFSLLAFSSYGSGAWLPEVFRRVHGWETDTFGLVYGITIFVCGAGGVLFGGVLADWLSSKGYRDAKIRVGFIAAWIWFPSGIAFPLLANDIMAMALVVPTVFFAAMPFGVAPAAIQELMPNNLRGRISAIYLFMINMIGLAVGPLVLALMTDYVFTEAAFGLEGIRYSLLTFTVTAHLVAGVLLWVCMGHFRDSLVWREQSVGKL